MKAMAVLLYDVYNESYGCTSLRCIQWKLWLCFSTMYTMHVYNHGLQITISTTMASEALVFPSVLSRPSCGQIVSSVSTITMIWKNILQSMWWGDPCGLTNSSHDLSVSEPIQGDDLAVGWDSVSTMTHTLSVITMTHTLSVSTMTLLYLLARWLILYLLARWLILYLLARWLILYLLARWLILYLLGTLP
jgi:hypothetical protein